VLEVVIESSSTCQIWGRAFHCIPETKQLICIFESVTCFKVHAVRRLSILKQIWTVHSQLCLDL